MMEKISKQIKKKKYLIKDLNHAFCYEMIS